MLAAVFYQDANQTNMWNITEADKKYYERREQEETKHRRALSKAAYRGEVSVEWHKHNTLTAATLPEFKKAMKKADKDWDVANGS